MVRLMGHLRDYLLSTPHERPTLVVCVNHIRQLCYPVAHRYSATVQSHARQKHLGESESETGRARSLTEIHAASSTCTYWIGCNVSL